MKAQILTAETGPAGLEFRDVDDPVPTGEQLLIEIRSCGVCFPDLLMSRGEYQLRLPVPYTPGTEVAGVVAAAPSTSRYTTGDRVVVTAGIGGFAERVLAVDAQVMPLPPELSFDEGAALGINFQTALFALDTRARVSAGETVGVLGAAGGVGVATIAVAKALGARVIAIVHREGAEQMLRDVGADEVVALRPGWGDRIRELTGTGVDVLVDPVGGEVFDDALRQVAPDGRYVVVGFAAGGIPTVKLNRVLFRNIAVVGAAWGEYARTHPDLPARLHERLTQMVAEKGLRPPVGVTYRLEDLPRALQDLSDGKVLGKAVVRVA